jgi:hypothetical protein
MLDYLNCQDLRISELVTMIINDHLLPGITLASIRPSNCHSFCCLSNQGVLMLSLIWDGKGDGMEHKEEACH